MRVLLRTHGGLGNQLFQVLYGRLRARLDKAELLEVHDERYAHRFERSRELIRAPLPPLPLRALSATRLPKVLERLGHTDESLQLPGLIILDGYFQRVENYTPFAPDLVTQGLTEIRSELAIPSAFTYERGIHLRLGDFFKNSNQIESHLVERLAKLPRDAVIVTNDEDRLATPRIAALLTSRGATLLPTSGMRAEEVLRTLASIRSIAGNDSTLLFWATTLSGSRCEFATPGLAVLQSFFASALARGPQ